MMTDSAGTVPIRYLGSKARLAPKVAASLAGEANPLVVDLFAGMGHVTAALAGVVPVAAHDVSPAAVTVLRWRLENDLDQATPRLHETVPALAGAYVKRLREAYRAPLSEE